MKFSSRQLAQRLVKLLNAHPKDQDEILKAFAQLLVQHRLRHKLPQIIRAVQTELNDQAGIVRVKFTSATEVNASQMKQLKQVFTSALGKDIEMETHQDQHLVGGAVVQVGDALFDGSVRTQLASLRKSVETYG